MSKKCFLLLLCPALICVSLLSAEAQSGFTKQYLVSYPLSVKVLVTEPSRWQTDDWITVGGVLLAAGSLYLADQEIRKIVQDHRTDWAYATMNGVGQFGEGKYLFPAVGTTILAGYFAGSEKTANTGLLCLKSMILASSATQALKLATQRSRPDEENGGIFWPESSFSLSNDSFPSGHSTLVWSVAPILAEQYSDHAWVPPLVYGLAILTSSSRVYKDHHWSSDVFCGALIGYISASITLKSTPRLAVSPAPELNGLSFRYDF